MDIDKQVCLNAFLEDRQIKYCSGNMIPGDVRAKGLNCLYWNHFGRKIKHYRCDECGLIKEYAEKIKKEQNQNGQTRTD